MKAKKKNLAVHFSSATDDWATPQAFFDEMNAKYGPFDLDVCASKENAKCTAFFTEEYDGLEQSWVSKYHVLKMNGALGTIKGPTSFPMNKVWMNPPYGREIGKWVKKAYDESLKGCLVVALLPARTDTKYFHSFIYGRPNVSVEFLKGRLKFGGAKNSAPFPSMVVVFRPVESK